MSDRPAVCYVIRLGSKRSEGLYVSKTSGEYCTTRGPSVYTFATRAEAEALLSKRQFQEWARVVKVVSPKLPEQPAVDQVFVIKSLDAKNPAYLVHPDLAGSQWGDLTAALRLSKADAEAVRSRLAGRSRCLVLPLEACLFGSKYRFVLQAPCAPTMYLTDGQPRWDTDLGKACVFYLPDAERMMLDGVSCSLKQVYPAPADYVIRSARGEYLQLLDSGCVWGPLSKATRRTEMEASIAMSAHGHHHDSTVLLAPAKEEPAPPPAPLPPVYLVRYDALSSNNHQWLKVFATGHTWTTERAASSRFFKEEGDQWRARLGSYCLEKASPGPDAASAPQSASLYRVRSLNNPLWLKYVSQKPDGDHGDWTSDRREASLFSEEDGQRHVIALSRCSLDPVNADRPAPEPGRLDNPPTIG